MIVTTEALVLRARKQGETSKIVTLYTLDFGKLNVIAKGARETKSKFGGALEAFARINAVFYKKEKNEPGLYLLSKAELIESHSAILQNLNRMSVAMSIAELLLRAMHDEEANPSIFQLTSSAYHALTSGSEESSALLEFYYYIEFAKLMGFDLTHISAAGAPDDVAAMIEQIQRTPIDRITTITLNNTSRYRLRSFLTTYMTDHLPGVSGRVLKSSGIFGQMGVQH